MFVVHSVRKGSVIGRILQKYPDGTNLFILMNGEEPVFECELEINDSVRKVVFRVKVHFLKRGMIPFFPRPENNDEAYFIPEDLN
jgi:hypothetical protein